MNYPRLGNTDIRYSELVLGCWALGGGSTWGDQDEELSVRTVHAALESGINCFDTAEFYGGGRSEEVLGKALAGKRQRAVVATKLWVDNMGREATIRACEGSLKRLQTDYIDLYMIHWPNREVALSETLEAMLSLKRDGKVRALGVCNFGALDLAEALALADIVVDQLPYSLLFRAIEFEVLPACLGSRVPVWAYSTLAQGLLTGKFASAADVNDERARIRFYTKERPGTVHDEEGYEREVFGAIPRLKSLCETAGVLLPRASMAWVLRQPGVAAVLIGARTPEQIVDNVAFADLELGEDLLRQLEQATGELKELMGANPDMWRTRSRFR